jgi:3-demethylubiquinone-9 3-methyltransferase
VDYYWEKLSAGSDEKAQQCGWLKDKYGVSWQTVPRILVELLSNTDAEKSQKVMTAMLKMNDHQGVLRNAPAVRINICKSSLDSATPISFQNRLFFSLFLYFWV